MKAVRNYICAPLEPFFQAVNVPDDVADSISLTANSNDVRFGERVEKYYADTVVPHKIAVYNAGMRLAENPWFVGFAEVTFTNWRWQMLIHDLSKLSWEEADGYAYCDFNAPTKNGPVAKANFATAWLHHKNHNPHHPEYWMNVNRGGKVNPLEMPARYVAEMVADWIGAGEIYGQPLEQWLPANLETFQFHEETAKKLTFILHRLDFKVLNHGNVLTLLK